MAIIIEETFDAPAEKVWEAITEKDQMIKWYFDLSDFKPVVGFKTDFTMIANGKEYPHLWKVTEVIPGKKIAYEWKYGGYPGNSLLNWELFPLGNQTKLKLTHEGIESFPQDNPDFAESSFRGGWNAIIHDSLKPYLDNKFAPKP